MTNHPDTLRWFPLVARPRPACPPLNRRIDDIAAITHRARMANGPEALTLAAAALNKAALIASDSGLSDLAEGLCLQQLLLYQQAQPLNAQSVRHALEPVVNIARLQIRAGQADQGHQLLTDLLAAAKARARLSVAGHVLNLDDLMTNEAQLATVQWLWTVMLSDGTRALASAGRWAEALDSVKQHTGIGVRLLDGRQVAVIAHLYAGDHHAAHGILSATQPVEDWERSVQRVLGMLCQLTNEDRSSDSADMPCQHDGIPLDPELVVFRTRLTLAAIDFTHDNAEAMTLLQALHRDASVVNDGYAARDVLTHPTSSNLSSRNRSQLELALAAAGLDNSIQPQQLRRLLDAALASTAITSHYLLAAVTSRCPRPR